MDSIEILKVAQGAARVAKEALFGNSSAELKMPGQAEAVAHFAAELVRQATNRKDIRQELISFAGGHSYQA